MTRLSPSTTNRSYHLLHHDNGAHRGTAPTALSRDLEAFERNIRTHLTDHDDRKDACGTEFDHTPDRDVDPGPDCAVCGRPRE